MTTTDDNRRILVIDDSPSVHKDFRKFLGDRPADPLLDETEGALFREASRETMNVSFALDSAHQGEEGLAKVKAAVAAGQPYALAFVDVRMPPGWDGVETIAGLWAVDPELEVVICTAYSDYSWDEIDQRLGRSDQWLILKKPFEYIEVVQLAKSLTEKWKLARQARQRTEELEHRVVERTRQLEQEICERQQVEQQRAVEQERTRVAQDLHDELGSSLTEISMLGHLASAPETSPAEKQNSLDEIIAKSRQMVAALDEIVWAVNPKHDSSASLASYLCLHAQRFLELCSLQCRLAVPADLPDHPLDPRQRHGLFLAFQEALNNVARHARATEVTLAIGVRDALFEVTITDNGCGFGVEQTVACAADGLANLRHRMEALGGHCKVTSQPGHGSIVRLSLPFRGVNP